MHTKVEVSSFTDSRDMQHEPKIIKVGHVTEATPLVTYFCILWFAGLTINVHTKFEVSASPVPEIYRGSKNYKSRSRDVGDAPLDLILHFLA